MQPALRRLADLAGLPEDWDSYGASPPSARAISTAYNLLFALEDRFGPSIGEQLQPYAVAPLASGGVQLQWRGLQREIEVDIDPTGRLGYLLIEGESAARTFSEADDVVLPTLLLIVKLMPKRAVAPPPPG
jgi:hypothetical protein